MGSRLHLWEPAGVWWTHANLGVGLKGGLDNSYLVTVSLLLCCLSGLLLCCTHKADLHKVSLAHQSNAKGKLTELVSYKHTS